MHIVKGSRARRWLIGGAIALALAGVVVLVAAALVGRRVDPYAREQAIKYLREKFDGEVEVGALHVGVPALAPWRLLFFAGRGALVTIQGERISIRHHGRRDIPPLFVLESFQAEVDLGTIFDNPKTVNRVVLEGMELNVPPKGERAPIGGAEGGDGEKSGVIVEDVVIRNAKLTILPKDKSKTPLRFALHDIRLQSVGKDVGMKYEALLTNPKPPGEIRSTGTFGPWVSGEPGSTPLGGEYLFENADLGVFKGIAGILRSTGTFEGSLSSITARGEASVPDFRLKNAGNPVPLKTKFEVLVDGTNGNTVLQPVMATLGSTQLTTKGFIVKHDGDPRKTISLDASIPAGNLQDVLRLAMKGTPMLSGIIRMDTTIDIPPENSKVKEKLKLDGTFDITNGKFLRSNIQDRIDGLSRRAQGKPTAQEIDEVIHRMTGEFTMDDEVVTFQTLAFEIPGAAINIGGTFDIGSDVLDFQGAVMLDAKVSQTMTGWKRWVLKPVDPFFSKRGAGTFFHIKVEGSSKNPKFGLDPGGTSPREKAEKSKEK